MMMMMMMVIMMMTVVIIIYYYYLSLSLLLLLLLLLFNNLFLAVNVLLNESQKCHFWIRLPLASENFNSTHQTFYIFTCNAEQVIHRRHRPMNTYATQKLCIFHG